MEIDIDFSIGDNDFVSLSLPILTLEEIVDYFSRNDS